MSSHLPECYVLPFRDMFTEALAAEEPGSARAIELQEWISRDGSADCGILRCADGCPRLERALERGRELAAEYGWDQPASTRAKELPPHPEQ